VDYKSDRDGEKEFVEKLITLNRTAKVVKGGRRFSFSALVVVGDKKGRVGYGFGKANDVSEAIRKSVERAKKSMIMVPVRKNTIPHEVTGDFKACKVYLRPAAPGAGVIAGGPARAIFEACGISDILSKSVGSRNQINVVRAVFNGISKMYDAKQIASSRGKSLQDLWG
jgi:small subunit ribosomal protein S5